MFRTQNTPLLDRITPAAMQVKLSDPRSGYSYRTKRATLNHAEAAALRDGDTVAAQAFADLRSALASGPQTPSLN